VEWVDPAAFARAVSPSDGLVPEPAANPKAPQAQCDPAEPAKSMAKKGLLERLPKYPWR
jgi:hypothetical protein